MPGASSSTPARRETGSPDEAAVLRRIVALCGHLSAFAAQNVELSELVRLLGDNIAARVALLDRDLDVLACAETESSDLLADLHANAGESELSTALVAAARHRRALTVPAPGSDNTSGVIVAPVLVGDDVGGYLLTHGSKGEGLSENMLLLATEHAAVVCGVVLGRDLVVAAASGRARQELVEGLLAHRNGDDTETDRWARHLGLDPGGSYYVITFTLDPTATSTDYSLLETLIARQTPQAVVVGRTEEVVAIVPVGDTDAPATEQGRAVAQACITAAEKRMTMGASGIGNPCASVGELPRSYAEASRALTAGRRMSESQRVAVFADLGIHRLLLRVPDVGDLRTFANEVAGPLLEEEQATGMDYLTTLSVYFHANSSPRRAGQQLYLHANTVSYRLRRVEEITGLALDTHRDRLMLEVAVEILQGLGRGS